MRYLKAIWLGIKRRPLAFFFGVFLGYSALWTIVESASYFFPEEVKLQGAAYYKWLLVVSVLIGCLRAYQPQRIRFKIGHSNTAVTVYFGDLFEGGGYQAIPVNECFDSEIGTPVSPNSLHGMLINRYFGGHATSFDQLVTKDLANVPAEAISRAGGKTQRYAIGTTACVTTHSHRFLLVALCNTDVHTSKASAGLPELVRAIEGLCNKARVVLGGEKLVVPLIGSGLSGIGLPPHHLLQQTLLLLINETKKSQFALEIDVVIHPSRFEEIDLRLVEEMWT